jgi:hypothetical protein
MFYFIDNNYPEVVYYGNQAGFDWVQEQGGYPQRYTPKVEVPVGGTMEMKVGGNIEHWPVVEMVR